MKKITMCMVAVVALVVFFTGCAVEMEQGASDDITQIACGEDFTLFLHASGKVSAIGKNVSGQLGVGDMVDRYNLTKVLLPEPVQNIGVSDDSAYALTKDNRLYLWGDNRYRQVENSDVLAVASPELRTDIVNTFEQFALGWIGAFLLTDSGDIYGWGHKYSLMTLEDFEYDPIYQTTPLRQIGAYDLAIVNDYTPTNVKKIAVASGGVMGIAEDGTFFGVTDHTQATPFAPGEIVKIVAGSTMRALLTKEGNIYIWGDNVNGELGMGNYAEQTAPQMLRFSHDPLQDIVAGPRHILALTRSGNVLAWGNNQDHQLGLSAEGDVLIPTLVELPEEIIYVATGFRQSYFIGKSGQIYASGDNRYGQLLISTQTASGFGGDRFMRVSSKSLENNIITFVVDFYDEKYQDIYQTKIYKIEFYDGGYYYLSVDSKSY